MKDNLQDSTDDQDKWQNATFSLLRDAQTGQRFRGILHNINGALQAFSMQAELLAVMFSNLECLCAENADLQADGKLQALHEILIKRKVLADQMMEKVLLCQEILSATIPLRNYTDEQEKDATFTNRIIYQELEYLNADSYFKHRITKQIDLAADLPLPNIKIALFRFLVNALLQNVLDALVDIDNATLRMKVWHDNETLTLQFVDNGKGFPGNETYENLTKPFFSTRDGHLGLGLYYVNQIVTDNGGSLQMEQDNGSKVTVCLPIKS